MGKNLKKTTKPAEDPPVADASQSSSEMIKVIDRGGNVKIIPRAHYDQKKRSRKKKTGRKMNSIREILSIVFIVVVMAFAAWFALKLVQ